MKKIRRITAVILAMVMVFGTMTNVFAASSWWPGSWPGYDNNDDDDAVDACGKPVENSGNNRGKKKALQIF